jgi:PhnB protein
MSPYLSFRGDAREAMDFYHSVFGGTLEVTLFSEFGIEPGEQIMHAQVITDGFTLMGSDVPPGMDYHSDQRVHVILHGDDEATLRSWWDGLAQGATVTTPLEAQMWGDMYGALTDRFGIEWSMNISPAA